MLNLPKAFFEFLPNPKLRNSSEDSEERRKPIKWI